LDSLAGFRDSIFQKWLTHPAYDAYWQSLVPTPAEYSAIRIPVLTTTGYYDGSQLSAIRYFNLHNKFNKEADHYLVIGPYDHWGAQRKPAPELMGYKIDSVANISMIELAYQWLDYILKGSERPALLQNKINYQVMGTNEWKHKAELKDINNDTLTFYLQENALSTIKHKNPKFQRQEIDFKDRKTENNFFTPSIIFDTLDASGGLIFQTPAFKHGFAINGSFTGNLVATINKKDMDISVALFELNANGKYFFLARYLGRASYATNPSERKLLPPNKKVNIPFNNTRFVSKKISPGSRLVILLNINKHPFEIINYGSGKEVSDETINDAGELLHIKWHNESMIRIPVWKD
jgi:predicted acyl esterase